MGLLSLFGSSGKKAQQAALQASEMSAKGIDRGRAYLEQQNQLPSSIRQGAMTGLAGYFGIPGFDNMQDEFITQARNSPLYNAILGSREAGERSILRNQAATGGLRSGSTNMQLSDYNQNLENTALLESLNQQIGGFQNLMGLETYAPQISEMMGSAAFTRGQGVIAGQQALEQAKANQWKNLLGVGKLGLQMAGLPTDSIGGKLF